jgi:hypothetical protein
MVSRVFLIFTIASLALGFPRFAAAKDTFVLQDPKVFSLRMANGTFKGRLPNEPDVSSCHTQGIEIVNGRLFVSCILYKRPSWYQALWGSKGYLFSQSLSEIENPRSTEPLPWEENKETQAALSLKMPRGTWVAAHPSGIIYDPTSKSLWMAGAVYAPNSFANVFQIDPSTMKIVSKFSVPNHLGALARFGATELIGPTWASFSWLGFDLADESRQPLSIQKKLEEAIDYQDCSAFDSNSVLCGGNLKLEGEVKKRFGRLNLLHLSEDRILTQQGEVRMERGNRKFTTELGRREYQIEQGMEKDSNANQYGDYQSYLSLTNNGMSLSEDKQFIYFLPDDLPSAKLIRYRLLRTKPL